MADLPYWSREFIKDFLVMYKSLPCLWRVKSKEYTNKRIKNIAYNKLVELTKRVNPDSDKDYVVKKIQSFRGSFRKEMKKVADSKQSAATEDEIYIPSLWYYDLLLFTTDQEMTTITTTYTKEEVEDYDIDHLADDATASNASESTINESNDNTQDFSEVFETPSTSSKKTMKTSASKEALQLMEFCKRRLERNDDTIEEYDAVAISWAKKLKRMEPTQAIYAESIINQAVTRGLLNQLTDSSEISRFLP